MRQRVNLSSLIMIMALFSLSFNCQQKKTFEGGSGTVKADESDMVDPPPPDPQPTQPADPNPPELNKCVVGDKPAFKFEATIQECVDSGRIYNFETSTCTGIGNNTEFSCNFDSLEKATATLLHNNESSPISSIRTAKEKGAILIACGSKEGGMAKDATGKEYKDGDIIVAQWYYPGTVTVTEDCQFKHDQAQVYNACYKRYPSGQEPEKPETPEEIKALVQKMPHYRGAVKNFSHNNIDP